MAKPVGSVRPVVTIQKIAVAYDGEAPAAAALREAADLARSTGASLTLVTVVPSTLRAIGVELPPGSSPIEVEADARAQVEAARAKLEHDGLRSVTATVLLGEAVDRVVDFCVAQHVDLLVVGSRGLSGTGRFFLGSVSDGILHHAPCSVLVVKSPPKS